MAELSGNRKKIPCPLCNGPFHSENGRFILNRDKLSSLERMGAGSSASPHVAAASSDAAEAAPSAVGSASTSAVVASVSENSGTAGIDVDMEAAELSDEEGNGKEAAGMRQEADVGQPSDEGRRTKRSSKPVERYEAGPASGKRSKNKSAAPVAGIGQEAAGISQEAGADAGAFNKKSFMDDKIFLLNSFMDAKARVNQGFGPFIREGVATPGYKRVSEVVARMVPTASYEELRDEIFLDPDVTMSSARKVALWLKDVTVGSFIVMRHEYKDCPFLPSKLKDSAGKYAGKVYAIGVVTQVVKPCSEEEEQIARKQLGELNGMNNFCFVSWKKMGMKKDLHPNSRAYINVVCQPTLAKILQPGKEYEGGKYVGRATTEDIRRDLWDNATIPISPADFPEICNRKNRRPILKDRKAKQYMSSDDES